MRLAEVMNISQDVTHAAGPWRPQLLSCCVLCQGSSYPTSRQKGDMWPLGEGNPCKLGMLNHGVKGPKH